MPAFHHISILARPRPVRGLWRRLFDLAALAQSRRALARLDDRLLRDIGLTREDAEAELARPPWDAPSHWRD